MLGKMEGKRGQPSSKANGLVAMYAPLENLQEQVRDRSLQRKKSIWLLRIGTDLMAHNQ